MQGLHFAGTNLTLHIYHLENNQDFFLYLEHFSYSIMPSTSSKLTLLDCNQTAGEFVAF